MDKFKFIEEKIGILKGIRDSIKENNDFSHYQKALVCFMISDFYNLQGHVLHQFKVGLGKSSGFVTETAALRIFRDAGLDEVADIYSEVRKIAVEYIDKDCSNG